MYIFILWIFPVNHIFNFQFSTFSFQFFGAFRQSRRAFRYIFARFIPNSHPKTVLGTSAGSVTSFPSPKLVLVTLAKDAAPIPNAWGCEQ